MKTETIAILLGCTLAACGGKGAVTLLSPNVAYPARTVDIQLAGAGTAFTASSTIDFGDSALAVSNIAMGSDDNLRATVTIAANARLGDHDVTVNSSGESITLSKGFKIVPSLKPDMMGQMVQQGSLLNYSFLNLDYVVNPLDQFARLNSGVSSVPGTNNITGSRMTGMSLADVLTPAGPVGVQAVSISPLEQFLTFVSDPADPLAPTVSARQAMAISVGGALANQSHMTPRSNNLYSFPSTAADQIALVQFSMLGTAFVGMGTPSIQGAFAGADGKWNNGQFADASSDGNPAPTRTMMAYLPMAGDTYLTTFPNNFGGSPNYTYTLTANLLPGTRFSMVEPQTRDTGTTPLYTIASLSSNTAQFATDGQTEDATDSDYIRYTAAPGVTRVYIQLLAPGTSASVTEYGSQDCTTTVGANNNQSNVASVEVAAAAVPHCIRVRASMAPKYPFPYRLIIAAR